MQVPNTNIRRDMLIENFPNTADKDIDQVTNFECNHATDPNITFVTHTASSGTAAYIANGDEAFVRLYFLDSDS